VLTLTYEYKAMPTNEQIQLIEHTLTVCRKAWNFALRERKDWLNSRKCPANACSIISEYIIPADTPYPNYYEQANSLTRAKAVHPELKTVNAKSAATGIEKTGNCFC
jgi:putative transposase